jgi:hypothetical protein
MALDFQQVLEQVRRLGENAPLRQLQLKALRKEAGELLNNHASDYERMRQKVRQVVREIDPSLRCALPVGEDLRPPEPLNRSFPLPPLPSSATILAADGSQINPDRHSEVEYCLINVGAIQMCLGSAEPPKITFDCQLFYDEGLYTQNGTITEARLALLRDLSERKLLATLAEDIPAPVVTFTDGPIELWGSKDSDGASEFQRSLNEYLEVLGHLYSLKVITSGYVDKPSANLVVRTLEVMKTPGNELRDIRDRRPLRGVTDAHLFRDLLAPGERSAVFSIQSQSAKNYKGPMGLHFFYLNTGRPGHPWLARVEIPAWVAGNLEMLDRLHAVLVHQCQIMGTKPYPYLLHRAHETALVNLQEKEQVTQMITLELRRRGVEVGERSNKQSAKDLGGRTRL